MLGQDCELYITFPRAPGHAYAGGFLVFQVTNEVAVQLSLPIENLKICILTQKLVANIPTSHPFRLDSALKAGACQSGHQGMLCPLREHLTLMPIGLT